MKQRGFTLIELLVASAIVAVLSALTGTLVLNGLSNEQRISAHAEALQAVALGLQTIRRDLEQTENRIARDAQGDLQAAPLIGGTAGDTALLRFTHSGRRQFPGASPSSGLERVQYLQHDGDWIRLSSAYTDAAPNSKWQSRRLFAEVDNIRLGFYDGAAWQSSWPPPAQEIAGLPKAVKITFDSATRKAITLTVLIPGDHN